MFSDRMWEQSLRESTLIEETHYKDHKALLVSSDKPVGSFIYPFRMFFFPIGQDEPILALNLEFSGGETFFLGVNDSRAHYNYGKTDLMPIEDFKDWALKTAGQYLSNSSDRSDADRDEPIVGKQATPTSLGDSVDLEALAQQFTGQKFGELVLHHYKKQDLQTVAAALQGTIEEFPQDVRPIIETWIDKIGAFGRDPAFWKHDLGKSLKIICNMAHKMLDEQGIEATPDLLLNMFNIIVLNFAYGAHKHPQNKAFIQKSIGKGFLSRLFS